MNFRVVRVTIVARRGNAVTRLPRGAVEAALRSDGSKGARTAMADLLTWPKGSSTFCHFLFTNRMSGFRQLHREAIGKSIVQIVDCRINDDNDTYDFIVAYDDEIKVKRVSRYRGL
jgi:hypothetical protein